MYTKYKVKPNLLDRNQEVVASGGGGNDLKGT